jgi:DMSO/TMAO reductase YedYZ molybdopterin-dependent catalytic subunit
MPVFTPKNVPSFNNESWRLTVNGLVKKPLELSFIEILKLPTTCLTADFTCVEGWTVKDVEWEGVKVNMILDLADPIPSARYASFKAGEFTTTLSLADVCRNETILAYRHRGQPLAFEHGAPLRLIWASQECYESIKWVNHVELVEKYVEGTGKKIALDRLKPT